ncbi:hypothetical protein BDA99DRAFT_608975 [Phascolomyces articulosus]|uniref:Uncharacterized protein n=1 Tax=Phascolomyces articulosus TaxID=60185 RepID=A0AAD5JQ23_9FUNG|nr:hypothetical protein BDA99DRAFT_608975 [Phascolomyces articulosus]
MFQGLESSVGTPCIGVIPYGAVLGDPNAVSGCVPESSVEDSLTVHDSQMEELIEQFESMHLHIITYIN